MANFQVAHVTSPGYPWLVIDRAAGTRRIYQVDPAGVRALRAQLDRFWSKALANFKEIAEQAAEEAS